jgi:O-antigen/teichoic acid export membrane protein
MSTSTSTEQNDLDTAKAPAAGGFAWGFVAQGFSSAVNFGLAVMAGQLLGPKGLGVVFIGSVAYQFVLGLQRGIITQPLIAGAAPLTTPERHRLSQSGLTIVVLSGSVFAASFGLAGFAVGGDLGRGLLLFAPWTVAGLLHEFWKAVLFQEGKGRASAVSEGTRLTVMALSLPLALRHRNDYIIVGIWGIAATVGFGVALLGLRVPPGRPADALSWLRHEAWALGRWLGAREIVYQVGTYSTVLALAVVIGSANLGGLRSAEALFSPFSLIAAAFLLPALPALSRELATSRQAAQRLALRITGVALAIGASYFAVMALLGSWLLVHVFGRSFEPFRGLIWPMGSTQLLGAASLAFTILLIAERRGLVLLAVAVVGAITNFGFATTLGAANGVTGAAWGFTFGAAVSAIFLVVGAVRRTEKQTSEAPSVPGPQESAR